MGLFVQVLSQEGQVILAGEPPSCSSGQPPGNYSSLISLSLPVGHGQSEGERMVVSDFHVFIRDVLQHVDTMQKDYPGLPVFLLGHSMVSRPQKTPPKSSPVPSLAADGRCENAVMKRGSPPHLFSALLARPPPHAVLRAPGQCSAWDKPGSTSWRQPQRELPIGAQGARRLPARPS